MIDEIKYRWRLRRLFAEQAKNVRFYNRVIKKARAEGEKRDEIELLRGEASGVYFEKQEEIDELTALHLLNLARKLFLPIPDRNDKEMWSDIGYRRKLTESGIANLRKAIRREQKERRQAYLPWIAGLTGLIGAITGLLAIVLR